MGLLDQSPLMGLLSGYLPTGLENMRQGNQAIRQGADATLSRMRGQELAPEEQAALSDSPIGGMGANNIGAGGAMMGTFAGRLAQTANKTRMNQAERMLQRGMDPEHIRKTTGWHMDPGGDWKWEFSDRNASMSRQPDGSWTLRHREFERAYPEIASKLKIETIDPHLTPFGDKLKGAYNPETGTIQLSNKLTDPKEALSTVLHELQHAVQDREGFSPGTSQMSDVIGQRVVNEYWPELDKLQQRTFDMRRDRDLWMARTGKTLDDFYKEHPDFTKQYDDLLAQRRDYPNVSDWTWDKYQQALGEIESRDTQHRQSFSADQRRQAPPYASQGIPTDKIWDVRDYLPPDTTDAGGLLNMNRSELLGLLGAGLGIGGYTKKAE